MAIKSFFLRFTASTASLDALVGVTTVLGDLGLGFCCLGCWYLDLVFSFFCSTC